MKYLLFPVLLLCVLSTACRKKTYAPPMESYRYCLYEPGTRIDTVYNKDMGTIQYVPKQDSTHASFHYINGYNRLDMTDGSFAFHLMFSIDSSIHDFSYTDAQLKEHNTVYSSGYGFGGASNFQLLDHGTISGHRLYGNTWQLHIAVDLNSRDVQTGIDIIREDITASTSQL